MAYTAPTVTDFKEYFARDFVYGVSIDKVRDSDVTIALAQAGSYINSDLFDSQGIYTFGYLLLAAYFLVVRLQASSQGQNGQFTWMTTSKSVGSVSEGLTIPDRILANPEYAMLTRNAYGAEFLFLILPYLSGAVYVVLGDTLP